MTASPPLAPPRPFPSVGMLGDGALARRIGRGDELAFEELYRRHHAPLYRYCVSILGNPPAAAAAVTVRDGSARVSVETPVGTVEVAPVLP
jgi:hypothetical protein